MEKRYGILLEDGANYLTENEFFELREKFKEQGMDLVATKSACPKASFNDISIFISQNTTEFLIAGLMMPVVYDTLKVVIGYTIRNIKEEVKNKYYSQNKYVLLNHVLYFRCQFVK